MGIQMHGGKIELIQSKTLWKVAGSQHQLFSLQIHACHNPVPSFTVEFKYSGNASTP